MGLLSTLFGGGYVTRCPMPPPMSSVLPAAAISALNDGTLPTLNISTLILTSGEVCHFVDKSCLVTQKTIRHTRRRSSGTSFRIAKGITYHTGGGLSSPVEQDIPVYTPGYLYITNKRIVFAAKEKAFDKKLSTLSALTPYSDAAGLQFGSKTYNLLIPSAYSAQRTLELLTR